MRSLNSNYILNGFCSGNILKLKINRKAIDNE
ncbi:hypothetical protein SAMN05428975_3442 [Mucilaginibacter sp. OK268]|nr:hypothetical protein SAMN05428975_3442 [Mucilaginibacter sp. OK268]